MSRFLHPLLGKDPLLTGATVVVLGVLILASVVQYLLAAVVFIDDALFAWGWLYDGAVGALILFIGVSWILAIVIAWVNGGPALVTLLIFAPIGVASLVRLEIATTIDLALASGFATLAVWLASWISYPPQSVTADLIWPGILGGVVSGVAIGAVWRGTANIGPYADSGSMLAMGLLLSGLVIGLLWIVAHIRTRA